MEIKYKPTKHFDGTVVIKMPRYKERIEMIKKLNLSVTQGEDSLEVEPKNKGIDTAVFMSSVVEAHIISVDVTHKESGLVIKTLEELECYKEGIELINEVGAVLFNGLALGNG
jgi:hypothetical protein